MSAVVSGRRSPRLHTGEQTRAATRQTYAHIMEPSRVAAIQGLTHPNLWLLACENMWKRRGASLTSTIKTNWVERLVAVTDSALFWFEIGGIAIQHGRIELRHVRSVKLMPPTSSGAGGVTGEELERAGPKHCLEVVGQEKTCVFGSTDANLVQAWLDALERAVHAAQASGASAAPDERVPAPMAVPASPALLRHELTGIVAMGILGKARQATTGHMKTALEHAGVLSHRDGRARDGWSTRVVVLTASGELGFFKPVSKKAPVRARTHMPRRRHPSHSLNGLCCAPLPPCRMKRSPPPVSSSGGARWGACPWRWPT